MAELARRAKIKQPSLWALEHQRTKKPKFDTLARLAGALGVPISEILAETATASKVDILEVYRLLSQTNQVALVAAASALLKSQK